MSHLTKKNARCAAVITLASAWFAVSALPAAAAAGDVDVLNTETVQVYLSAEGEVESKRIYEQLALVGSGEVDLRNPVATQGLRNLDGFGGFEVEDGEQLVRTTVSGKETLRSVSDFTGELPLDISIDYFLDGNEVEASDIVGAHGELEVLYTVRNTTMRSQEVEVTDGKGGTVTRTVDVPVPMVGSLTTTSPSNFTEVSSEQANIAGDGQGGTRLSFTMTLFPPLGSDTATFGYTARVTDAVVPPASVSALPVNPLESPTFATAAESYQGGADTGTELAGGAGLIDENLLKLRDGAGELLAGLIQLHDGATELEDGLAGRAAPGARKLAEGSGQLDEGAGKLRDGARQLDGGATKIADGAGQLAGGSKLARSGSQDLTEGLQKISGGLGQLAADDGLPAAKSGATQLKAGVDQILAGIGDVADPTTLIGGLHLLESKLGEAHTGAGDLRGGLELLRGDGSPATPGLVGAKGGVDSVQAGIHDAVEPGGGLDQLIGGLGQLQSLDDCGPVCKGVIESQIVPKVSASKQQLSVANQALLQVSGGLGNAIGALNTLLIPGLAKLHAGLGDAVAGAGALGAGAVKARGGLRQVRSGLNDLEAGLSAAVAGVLQLSEGAGTAHAGSSQLTKGLGDLADGTSALSAGAGQLADGTGDLATGAGTLAEGTGRLSTGAGDLSDGIDAAADGSGRLAEGLGTARSGAPRLVDGAEQLSTEGVQKLVEAGESTATDYGEMYAVLAAGAERAQSEKMVHGAPEGARALMAYSFEIRGDDGEGQRNLIRAAGGLSVLTLAGAGYLVRRRLG